MLRVASPKKRSKAVVLHDVVVVVAVLHDVVVVVAVLHDVVVVIKGLDIVVAIICIDVEGLGVVTLGPVASTITVLRS